MDQVDLARIAFKKYGRLRVRLRHPGNGRGGPTIWACVEFRSTGRAHLTDYLNPIYAVCPPPYYVYASTQRVSGGTLRYRALIRLEWPSLGSALKILGAIGWVVGKPSWDTRALALKRWVRYRQVSGSSAIA